MIAVLVVSDLMPLKDTRNLKYFVLHRHNFDLSGCN